MKMNTHAGMIFVWLLALLVCPMLEAKEEQRKCGMDRDYWLYTPDNMVTGETYWLVVGVHGFKGNGKGAAGLGGWVQEMDDVIVVGPTFPSTGPFYQGLQAETDKQLLDIYKALQKEFKLHNKMFLYGFSGGAQYTHRFVNKHPKHVIGLSAHSGGSWDASPPSAAKAVLWTVSCGLEDIRISEGSEIPRIDCFRDFYASMYKAKGFTCKPFVTGEGHRAGGEVSAATKECFRAATTGLFDYQRVATQGMSAAQRESWILQDTKREPRSFDDGQNKYELSINKDGWTVGRDALLAMAETRRMIDQLSATGK